MIFISNQEESIKTKNITEKITFDSVAAIMAQNMYTIHSVTYIYIILVENRF